MSKPLSLQAAQKLVGLRLSTQAANLPLRLRPVIVVAEDESFYRVTDLGTALKFELTIIR